MIIGPELPVPLKLTQVIESEDGKSLYTVGGFSLPDNTNYVKDIFKLVCEDTIDSCEWENTGVKLEIGRKKHVALPISKSLAQDLCH